MASQLNKISIDKSRCFNVQLCGNSSVGKTSIIHRLIYDNYLDNSVITLGVNYYKKTFLIGGEEIIVTLHDTSGQERYMDITKQSIRKADALIFVFDKTSEQSLYDLETLWISQFDKIVDINSIPLILIGNKQDLCFPHTLHCVSYDSADQFARHYDMAFFETSAASGHQIQTAFQTLVQRLYLQRKQTTTLPLDLSSQTTHLPKQNCC